MASGPRPVIMLESVSHWFRELPAPVPVVHDFTLSVAEREFVALVGPSGCGKTTVLNMIAGLITPELGSCEVYIEGQRVERPSRRIGYMFARDALLPWRSLRGNVELGLQFRGVPRRQRHLPARAAIEKVGLKGYERFYPGKLSQGMRQRANIARLLVTQPELFLLDEPFSAVDAQTRLVLQREFLKIWEEERKTVLLVTHDLAEAAALADRVIIMRSGRLIRELQVPFARPRSLDNLRFRPDFQSFLETLHLHLGDQQDGAVPIGSPTAGPQLSINP